MVADVFTSGRNIFHVKDIIRNYIDMIEYRVVLLGVNGGHDNGC